MSILAMAEAKLGRTTAAGQHAEAAVKLRPTDTQVLYNAAVAFDQAGRTDQAVPLLVEALTRGYNKQLVKLDRISNGSARGQRSARCWVVRRRTLSEEDNSFMTSMTTSHGWRKSAARLKVRVRHRGPKER